MHAFSLLYSHQQKKCLYLHEYCLCCSFSIFFVRIVYFKHTLLIPSEQMGLQLIKKIFFLCIEQNSFLKFLFFSCSLLSLSNFDFLFFPFHFIWRTAIRHPCLIHILHSDMRPAAARYQVSICAVSCFFFYSCPSFLLSRYNNLRASPSAIEWTNSFFF